MGTSFPRLQQEGGARGGFAANPGPSATWCSQGGREEDDPILLQDVHCEGTGGKSEISPPVVSPPLALSLQPPPMFSAPACLYPVQVLAVAAEAETCFFLLFKVCASLSPEEKKRSKKSHIFAADCDWLM